MAGFFDDLDNPQGTPAAAPAGGLPGSDVTPKDNFFSDLDAQSAQQDQSDSQTGFVMGNLRQGTSKMYSGLMRTARDVTPAGAIPYLNKALSQGADYYDAQAEAVKKNMSPDDQSLADKKYFTLDPEESVFTHPKALLGGMISGAPSLVPLLGAGAISKGMGMLAEQGAIRAGMSESAVAAEGLRAAAQAKVVGLAAAGGQLGYGAQFESAYGKVMAMNPVELAASPAYTDYLKQGYTPEVAKQLLATDFGRRSGMMGGATMGVFTAMGGAAIGSEVASGAPMRAVLGHAVGVGGGTLGAQAGTGQLGENILARTTGVKLDQPLGEGVGEATTSGFVQGMAPGVGFALTEKAAHSTAESVRAIKQQARDKAIQAQTGMTPEQLASSNAFADLDRNSKPTPLTGTKALVAQSAMMHGVDPELALTIVTLENSKFDPSAKNPGSSAHGLFQMIDSTWKESGGGDRNDPAVQAANGAAYLATVQERLTRAFGRPPTAQEMYIAHVFGDDRAKAIMRAPDGQTVGEFFSSRTTTPEATAHLIKSNGMVSDMTMQQMRDMWGEKVDKAQTALGFDPKAMEVTRAGNDAAAEASKGLEASALSLEERRTADREKDSAALSAEEQRKASDERKQVDELTTKPPGTDPGEAALSTVAHQPTTEPAPGIATVSPTLSPELATQPARYKVGKSEFRISFDSDLDKALFHIGREKMREPNDAEWLKFVMENTAMTEKEARSAGREIVQSLSDSVDPQRVPAANEIGDLHVSGREPEGARGQDETFVTRDEQESRRIYGNPNDRSTLGDTPVMAHADDGKVGLPLREAKPEPGQVVAVSHDTNVAPPKYVKAMQATLQDMVRRFAPNAKVILSFRTKDNQGRDIRSTAWYKRGPINLTNDYYQINGRPLYNHGLNESSSRNQTTQLKAGYSLAHEFGHLLMDHRFMEGLTKYQRDHINNISWDRMFTEDFLSKLPPDRAAVLREYNEIKAAGLKNEISKEEWARRWLSPWKVAHGWGTNRGIESFGRLFFGQTFEGMTTNQFMKAMHDHADILSPHEYMGEQMAKYAADKKLLERSPLGVREFFKETLASMRDFFKYMKGQKEIAAGVEFAKWVEDATSITAGTKETPPERVVTEKTKSKSTPKPRPAEAKPKPTSPNARPPEPKVPSVDEPPVTPAPIEDSKTAIGDIAGDPNVDPFAAWNQGLREQAQRAPEETPVEPQPGTEAVDPVMEELNQAFGFTEPAAEAQKPPGATNEEILSARKIMGTKEMREIKAIDPELHAEISELIGKGQLEQARAMIEQEVSPETANKMRWDLDDIDDAIFADQQQRVEKIMVDGKKSWFGSALGTLRDTKYFFSTMRQLAFGNPDIGGLQRFDKVMTDMQTVKARISAEATRVADAWGKLSKEDLGNMENLMRIEYREGEHWTDVQEVNGKDRHVPSEKLEAKMKEHGLSLSDTGLQTYLDVKNQYLSRQRMHENILVKMIETRLAGRDALIRDRKQALAQLFDSITSKPFIAQTRFGEYAFIIRSDDGRVNFMQYYETERARNRAAAEATKRIAAEEGNTDVVQPYKADQTTAFLRTVDPKLVSTFAQEFELTAKQKTDLKNQTDMAYRNAQTRKYSSIMRQIDGAMESDMQRNFADFQLHDGNNLVKIGAREHFKASLRMVAQDIHSQMLAQNFDEHARLQKVYKFMQRYESHIMWPAKDFQTIRSLVVMKMLWGNFKSALANLNSLNYTWANQTAKFGLVQGTVGTANAMSRAAMDGLNTALRKVSRGSVEGWDKVYSPEQRYALNAAMENGILDETFAAQLAAYANNSNLDRMAKLVPVRGADSAAYWANRMFDTGKRLGMAPMHLMEVYTRRVAFLSSFDNYMKQNPNKDWALARAMKDTQLLVGDMSKANRPDYARGWKAPFMIFSTYMQQMLYMLSGAKERAGNVREAYEGKQEAARTGTEYVGPTAQQRVVKALTGETVRYWGVTLALGGLMGAPMAEDVSGLIKWLGKMFGKDWNMEHQAYQFADKVHDWAHSMGMDISPRSIVHGGMQDFGIHGLTPSVDVSSSMGLGSVVPGLSKVGDFNKNYGMGDWVLDTMGPLGGALKQLQKSGQQDSAWYSKAFSMIAPNSVNNFTQAYKDGVSGKLYNSGGKVFRDPATGALRERTTGELLMAGASFQLTGETATLEQHYAVKEMQDYWMNRRSNLTAQYFEAYLQKDRESMADIRKALSDFNSQAPAPAKINGEELQKILHEKNKRARLDTLGINENPKWRPEERKLQESYGMKRGGVGAGY